ncbi:MAG: hypothetical protein OXC07_12925, partial [Kistimonas sp.]|nr:hypothetical protein [Kistimonas sp.]
SASRAGEGPVVAGPVARTVGRNNAMRVQDASANRVEAEGQGSPVVASLGWGHLDFENCTVGVSSGCPLKSTADDRLDQSNLTQNHIVARAAGMEARAHASLAGSYGQKDWQGVHRLEQWGMTGNTIKAQVNGSAAGLGLASLGLVHDLKDVEYSTGGGEGASRDNRKALFYIRQQKCSNNTVMGAAQERIQEGGPVASLSLTADHSRNQSLARNLFRVMHNQVSENGLVVDRNSGAGFNDTDAVLVGSFEHEAPTPECPASPFANRTCDTPGNGSLVPLDETTPVVLFLFSGGGRLLPILPKNDSALVWMSDAVCDSPSMIDEAAYAFGGDMADANYDCLRNPDAADCPSFARPCGYKYQTSCCNNTGTSGAVSCSEWNSDCPGAAADGVQIVVNSIAPDAWKEVNRAFCKRVPWIFDGKADLCAGIAGMRSCHNPGEELHDLVPTGTSWLLVTRQTWPAGSKGNDSNADLFRILSFSLSQSAQDSEPLWNSDAFTGKSNEAGQLYADTRVVPAGNGPIFALVDGKSLVYVYQIVATDQEPRLRFIDLSGNSTAMPVAWKLPTGAELMLVSREADGVSVWIKKRADAVVERFLLEDIQKNGTTAPVSSFGLTSGSDVEREPLALARPKDSLYSLHATGVEDATGREFEIRRWRWNISSPTATLDRDLKRCTRGMSPGRLVVTSLGVQRVPELSFPVGEGSFKPGVPAGGGCLEWEWQTLGHDVPCAVRPTVTLTSEVPVEAIASVVLVVTGGCIGLTAGVCVQKAYQYKKRKNSRPVDSVTRQRLPLLPLQEVLEASPYENVYDAIDDIHVYEDVSRADAVTRSEAENAGEVLPEYELPSGRESGGTEACTQINAEDAGEVLPEHQLPSGTESGGAKGYAQLNADDAGAVPPGYQMLSGTELGGAGGYAQLNAADADVMLPEHPLPSGTESGGAAGYAQLNAADAWAEQPEQQPSVGTDPGGAGGYVNIGGMAAGTEHTGDPPQPLSEPQPGGGAESAHGSILSEPEPGGTGGQVSLGGMTAGTEPAGDPPQPVSEPEPGGAGGYVNISGMTAGTQPAGDPPQSLSEPLPGGASADAHPGDVDVCAQQSQQQSSAGIESSALGLREKPGVADASERGNGRRGVASSLPPSTSTTTPPPRSFSVPLLLPEVTDPDGDGTDFPAGKLSAF